MSIMIDGNAMERKLAGAINASMERAVESDIQSALLALEKTIRETIVDPLVQRTLAKAEADMRKQMAVILISAIDSEYDFQRDMHGICVRVRHDNKGR